MGTEGSKELTGRQRQALPFLVAAGSVTEGCRAAGISRKQFYQWAKEPTFSAELARQKDALMAASIKHLQASTGKAITTLIGLLGKKKDPWLQKGVANDILRHARAYREMEEIEGRLESIERIVFERKTYK